MDSQDLVNELTGRLNDVKTQIANLQGLEASLQKAIDLASGTLQTQLTELETAKDTIVALQPKADKYDAIVSAVQPVVNPNEAPTA